MPIVVIGLNHRSSPVAVRERFAFPEARIPATLQLLRLEGIADEAVILSTCNRVEIYASTSLEPSAAFTELKEFLVTCHDYRQPLGNEVYAITEPQSLEHLFRVACGLDSMVLGETEILGQLKRAYELALSNRHTGGFLNKAFQRAFHVAKYVRTKTSIQRGSISVGSVAVELAERIFATLQGRQILVIGAGDTSEKTARALLSRGASTVLVANRSFDRAVALATALGGRAVRFDDWSAEFETIDIAISSTSAPHPILNREKLEPLMRLRKNRPLVLMDLAVPRDVDPEVNLMANVYLYNIDDLQAIADGYLQQRREEMERCEKIIQEKIKPLLREPATRGAEENLSPGACPVPTRQSLDPL
jgi:glutamyl-tRNA reductase